MRTLRTAAPVAALVLLALTACGTGGADGSPAPVPPGTTSPSATPDATTAPDPGSPQQEPVEEVVPASVVVTAVSVAVFGSDGSTLALAGYDTAIPAVVATLTAQLGAPVVSETDAQGTGCDTDQVIYDFGGLLLRAPGQIGTTGAWEAEVTAAATAGGVAISTVGGQQIGAPRVAFEAAVGDEVLIGEYPPSHWYGFDILNPEVPDSDHVGTLARFDADVLVQLNAPHLVYADC
jgi:hypothetical protein